MSQENLQPSNTQIQQNFEQTENFPTTPETSPIDEAANPSPRFVYDAKAQQRMDFEGVSDDFTITAVIDPIDDETYLSKYDRKAVLKITDNGQSVVVDTAEAMTTLFDTVVSDVVGIPGEKPVDWKGQLDADQIKIPMMSRFLAVSCYTQGVAWGQTEKAIISESYFNNEIVKCNHFLRQKNAEDVLKFRNLQKIPLGSKGKGLASSDIKMQSFALEKARMYDRMQLKPAEGYSEVVPIWHKVAVIDFIFSAGITAKK